MKKQLLTILETIDPENILSAEVREQLSVTAEALIVKKVEDKTLDIETTLREQYETSQAEAAVTAEKVGYEKGRDEVTGEADCKIAEAERNGFEAGVKEAASKMEVVATEYDEKIKKAVLKLGDVIEQYINLVVDGSVKETRETVETQVVEAVDAWMSAQVKEMYPADLIINYDRMVRLESTFDALKGILVTEDADVQKAVLKAKESSDAEIKKLRTESTQESQRRIVAERKLEEASAKALLCEKLEDLPVYERDILKKKFAKCSLAEINESFDSEKAKITRTLQVENTDAPAPANGIVTETVSPTIKEDKTQKVEAKTTSPDMTQWANIVAKSCK